MEITGICILGSGRMGAGIAQVAAGQGFEVRLQDIDEKQLKKTLDSMRLSLQLPAKVY